MFISALRFLIILYLTTSLINANPSEKKISEIIKEAKAIPGFLKLHQKDNQYFLVSEKKSLKNDFLFTGSVAKGVGTGGIFGGTMMKTRVVSFRHVNDNVQFLFRDVLHQSRNDKQIEEAVKVAFHDHIIASFPVLAEEGSKIVFDITSLFTGDLYFLADRLSRIKGGSLSFNPRMSYVDEIKNFKANTEVRSALAYTQRTPAGLLNHFEILMHYSFFPFPQNKYKPRNADQRIGFFMTEAKDFSQPEHKDIFVRYIHRWHLEKAVPSAKQSLPKQPIVFHLSRNIPLRFRRYVRDGVLEWNKAFEKIGFIGAVEVRIQGENEEYDPGNNDYHTISWITTDSPSYGAIGPSRVNPLNGQILDADILFDENRARSAAFAFLKDFGQKEGTAPTQDNPELNCYADHENISSFAEQHIPQKNVYDVLGAHLGLLILAKSHLAKEKTEPEEKDEENSDESTIAEQSATQTDISSNEKNPETKEEGAAKPGLDPFAHLREEFLGQAIKWVIMHEVGHTLGLRHNFKGSLLHPYEKLHDKELVAEKGLYGSVMDYPAINIARNPEEQGYFYSPTIGPWDYWAIEYGYSILPLKEEKAALKKIASRAGEKELAYATDEDSRASFNSNPDPYAVLYDIGSDPMTFAEKRIEHISESWKDIIDRSVHKGESYEMAERVFYSLVNEYVRCVDLITNFIGGKEFSRIHRGDAERNPIMPISFAKQHRALQLLKKYAFTDEYLRIPVELSESIPSSRWWSWGARNVYKPVDKNVYRIHSYVMAKPFDRLFSPWVLSRIIEQQELYAEKEDMLTIENVFDSIITGVFEELYRDETGSFKEKGNIYLSNTKRNLQRILIADLFNLSEPKSLGGMTTPYDARTIARLSLSKIANRIDFFRRTVKYRSIDSISKTHLDDSYRRIQAFLEANYITKNY